MASSESQRTLSRYRYKWLAVFLTCRFIASNIQLLPDVSTHTTHPKQTQGLCCYSFRFSYNTDLELESSSHLIKVFCLHHLYNSKSPEEQLKLARTTTKVSSSILNNTTFAHICLRHLCNSKSPEEQLKLARTTTKVSSSILNNTTFAYQRCLSHSNRHHPPTAPSE